MNPSELHDLLTVRIAAVGLSVDAGVINKLETYLRLLARWNLRINLTGFSLNPPSAQAVDRLIVEPLQIAAVVNAGVGTWVDLGSGGGSPAIPLYLYKPSNRLVLVESRHRKAAFLRETARELDLNGVEVVVDRAESFAQAPSLAAQADLVTIRGVQLSNSLLSAVADLLSDHGKAILVGAQPGITEIPASLKLVNEGDFGVVLAKKQAK